MSALLRFSLWTVLILGVIIGLLRFTIMREWRVPTNDPVLEASIMPTLRGGDLVLLFHLNEPVFGDLVLCPEPEAPGRVVVGRIIGEAGDRVVLKDGDPTVNGKRFRFERVCNPKEFTTPHPDDGSEILQGCMMEDLANNVHMTGTMGGHLPPRDYREVLVPPGHVFLISDNRLFPYDSRDYGPVERATCKERPMFRLVSRKGWMDSDARFMFLQ
jgi:signal peptidase I